MPDCCLSCFADAAITEKIQREGNIARCYFCGTDEILCIDASKLADLLELTMECFVLDEGGEYPHIIYEREFRILNDIVKNPESLWKNILGNEFNSNRYKLKYNTGEYATEWDVFKKEIVHQNRFFPQSSIFSEIFSLSEESLESNLFLKLIPHLSMRIHEGESFWRSRVSESVLTSAKMGMPPNYKASAGRANPPGIAYLYVADNLDTSIKEVRPSNGAQVFVSECSLTESLNLLDLTRPKSKASVLKFEENEIENILKYLSLLELFSNELSMPVLPEKSHLEYIPTQFFCEYLKTVGQYDGVVFNSSFGNGKNLVLFDGDTINIESPETYRITATDLTHEKIS